MLLGKLELELLEQEGTALPSTEILLRQRRAALQTADVRVGDKKGKQDE